MAGLIVSGVRAPLGAPRVAQAAPADKPKTTPPAAQAAPIDLIFVPPKAVAVIALRPAALFGRADMKPLADLWNDVGISGKRIGLKLENIDVVQFAVTALPTTPGDLNRFMIWSWRSKTPFDWTRYAKTFAGEGKPVEVSLGGKTYFKSANRRCLAITSQSAGRTTTSRIFCPTIAQS